MTVKTESIKGFVNSYVCNKTKTNPINVANKMIRILSINSIFNDERNSGAYEYLSRFYQFVSPDFFQYFFLKWKKSHRENKQLLLWKVLLYKYSYLMSSLNTNLSQLKCQCKFTKYIFSNKINFNIFPQNLLNQYQGVK